MALLRRIYGDHALFAGALFSAILTESGVLVMI